MQRFDWSVCPETQWSALASAQRALDYTAAMIALKGQQKAHLPQREWEKVPDRKQKKIDFDFSVGFVSNKRLCDLTGWGTLGVPID